MEQYTFKNKLGCWLNERWRAEIALRFPSIASCLKMDWRWLCNRHERLILGEGGAVCCDWENSSLLTAARVFPHVGSRLLRHCLEEWPLRLDAEAPFDTVSSPKISVILPVGGKDRIPQFRSVVSAFFGQTVADIEIIAVEQAPIPEIESHCPPGVRYLFIPREDGRQFNKSLTMNSGVRAARAPAVLLHDADVVPPECYVESTLEKIDMGWEAVRPVRFAFHLGPEETISFQESQGSSLPKVVAQVQANNPGLSTAVTCEAYWHIGGHDERFEGWGGEDWEFLDRLRERKIFPGGFAPALHLWHPPAGKKVSGHRNNDLVERLRQIPPADRIWILRNGKGGDRL